MLRELGVTDEMGKRQEAPGITAPLAITDAGAITQETGDKLSKAQCSFEKLMKVARNVWGGMSEKTLLPKGERDRKELQLAMKNGNVTIMHSSLNAMRR